MTNNINGFGAGDLRALDLLRQPDGIQPNNKTEQAVAAEAIDLSDLDPGEQLLRSDLSQPSQWLSPADTVPASITATSDLSAAVDAGVHFILTG